MDLTAKPPKNAALVVNSAAREGDRRFDQARERLTSLGVRLGETFAVRDPSRIPGIVRDLTEGGAELVVLGGGDGTVSSVVDFLADRPTALGLLPLGTANDFARTLQIPADLDEACATIATGKLVDVDLGLVGDDYFVNVASAGLSVEVTRALSPRLKRYAGALAYPLAALRAVLRHTPFRARLTFPDGDHEPLELPDLLQVAVGNGRFYGGGSLVAPDAGIDDHTLQVYAIRRGRTRDLIAVARGFRDGTFVREDNVVHLTTKRLRIETEPTEPLNVDGELVAHTPREFSVARNALHVIVPQESTAARFDGVRR